MLTMETVLRVRLAGKRDGRSVREIARKYRLSRNTVRKYLRRSEMEPRYQRKQESKPKLGPFVEALEQLLCEDWLLAKKERRTALMLFEELQRRGYQGAYDSVRRHVKEWKAERRAISDVFIPLSFDPGEAFQFDWSEETLILGGRTTRVSIAHVRLCHSRLPICIGYLRESLEMVMDAHTKAFAFFGGVCRRGIYDNMKTVVAKVLLGKERSFNPRFLALAAHCLFDPVACSPAAGWEKGQVENQVGVSRTRFFSKRRHFEDMDDLNQYLLSECLAWAKTQPHPQDPQRTIWEVYLQDERPRLTAMELPFDGFTEKTVRVTSTCLVHFDRNHYSVDSAKARRTVQVRAYAERVVLVSEGEVIGEHPRQFGRDNWQVTLPSGGLTLLQILIGVIDLTFCAAAMYVLMPDRPSIDFLSLMVIFVSATLLGFASNSPGGLGVFDAAMLLAMPQFMREDLVGALLLFRLYYYIVPFALALAIIGVRELLIDIPWVSAKLHPPNKTRSGREKHKS